MHWRLLPHPVRWAKLGPRRMQPLPRSSCCSSTSLPLRRFSASPCRLEAAQTIPSSQQPGTESNIPQNATKPASKARTRRRWRASIYSISFLVLGLASGSLVAAILVAPPVPDPDSYESEHLLSKLRKDLNELGIVKELRSHREEWLEYEAYMSRPPELKASSMTAGAMRGFGGLGIQRIFWNKEEQRLISIVFFGPSLVGWPGVVHGGAVATVLEENLERVANGPEFGSGSVPIDPVALKEVKLNYRKPTRANVFSIVKAEVEVGVPGSGDGTHKKVKAVVEDALTGLVYADASGSCGPR